MASSQSEVLALKGDGFPSLWPKIFAIRRKSIEEPADIPHLG
jgi:hypothetical protein